MADTGAKSKTYLEQTHDPFDPAIDAEHSWSRAAEAANVLRRSIVGRCSNIHLGSRQGRNIFCFSSPRSGSTAVLEFVQQDRRIKCIDEPLSANSVDFRRHARIADWRGAMRLQDRARVYFDYLDRIIDNRVTSLNPPLYRQSRRLVTDRVFFKILHGGEDMIAAFDEHYGGTILLLLRHPLAVARSHWKLPRVRYFLEMETWQARLDASQTKAVERILEGEDLLSIAVVDWCFQNFDLTRPEIPRSWTRISYEEIVTERTRASAYLRDRLKLNTPPEAAIGAAPSSTVLDIESGVRDAVAKGDQAARTYLTSRWRSAISAEEEARAFEILDLFGIDYYELGRDLPKAPYRLFG